MSRNFGTQRNREKRFSIDDAFEEETDDIEQGERSPQSHTSSTAGIANHHQHPSDIQRNYRLTHEMSRDSDSLIHDGSISELGGSTFCCTHPKVRENWRMVLAAVTLLVIGVGLLATGAMALADPLSGLQGAVFLLAGLICFVPGAYHVVFIYMAARGRRGYSFHQLPLFT